ARRFCTSPQPIKNAMTVGITRIAVNAIPIGRDRERIDAVLEKGFFEKSGRYKFGTALRIYSTDLSLRVVIASCGRPHRVRRRIQPESSRTLLAICHPK